MWNFIKSLIETHTNFGNVAKTRKGIERQPRSFRRLRMESLEERRLLAITVDNFVDELDADRSAGDTSLREAIADAAPSGDTIDFAPSLNGATIDLTLGEIAFNKDLTIDASMLTQGITIDANDPTPNIKNGDGIRIFNITGGDVTLKNLTLQGGDVRNDNGGAVRAVGSVSLELDSVTVRDSSASSDFPSIAQGGGLYFETIETIQPVQGVVEPRLVIRDSTFKDNIADDGGGVLVNLGGHVGDGDHVQAIDQRVVIESTQFLSNTAHNRGGGLALWQGAGGVVELINSSLSGNLAGVLQGNGIDPEYLSDSGGGVYAYLFSGDELPDGSAPGDRNNDAEARFVISGSTLDENDAGSYGGGIAICTKREDSNPDVTSQVEIINSTISSNQVLRNGSKPGELGVLGKGGGVALAVYPNDNVEGLETRFQNVTVTKNRGLEGGGIWSMIPTDSTSSNRTTLTNTIVSDNAELDPNVPSNLYGSFDLSDTQYNLIGTGSTVVSYLTPLTTLTAITAPSPAPFDTTNIVTDNPGLGPLQFNGGLTRTHRPQTGSPAIDAGDPSIMFDPSEFDQRGAPFDRVVGGRIDIGAVEYDPSTDPPALPKVANIIVSSSVATVTHAPFSFDTKDGGGEQLRSVPVALANRVQIFFTEEVNIAESDLRFVGMSSGFEPMVTSFSGFDSNTLSVTWTFEDLTQGLAVRGDNYLLSLTRIIHEARCQ